MSDQRKVLPILMAEDDLEDRLLTKKALQKSRLRNALHFVGDGEELLDYLWHRGKYSGPETSPRPGIILLDLNMPKKDGRQALEELKADPELRRIPVIVLTTSSAEEDILKSYDLGANSYIQKPVTFDSLIEVMRTVTSYWLQIVQLPSDFD